ncbi:receptor-like protein 13 isoform X1 [Populus alba x Populus x berolinensis]|uniref:Receptor-like protein 13 isoform X1 n=1 Tax=Populus alba x Populus x berolinensis TaxID=444605 RepID=A0AAD6PRI6_9ROSI|nr:receptor-like protein 13 isoform X1 [Populus alba x Populus x berolinensis]
MTGQIITGWETVSIMQWSIMQWSAGWEFFPWLGSAAFFPWLGSAAVCGVFSMAGVRGVFSMAWVRGVFNAVFSTAWVRSYELQQLSKLKYLDLRYNRFNNSILSSIVGLSSLKSLYLSYNRLEGLIDFKESLSTLKVLDLSGNNINKLVASRGSSNLYLRLNHITTYGSSFQLLQSLGAFPYLTKLDLSDNNFRGRILGDELQNLSSLQRLYLDGCSLDEHSLHKLGALSSLKLLSLSRVSGIIPYQDFLDLKNLKYLDLSSNTFNNSIFQTINKGICDLNHLQILYIDNNDLSGFLPSCLANLTSLQLLSLSSNHLKIPMSLNPLYNLSRLEYFDGSGNEIYAEEDDHNLSPKFQLEVLFLSGRGQSVGKFPKFLYHQVNLQYMGLTNIQIKGEFPNWLIENNTYLQELHLENCSLLGPFLLPKNSHMSLSFLSISTNHFQGQIPSKIGDRLPRLEVLLMSDNGFNGSIPLSLGNISSLQVLDLSNNVLTGTILSNNSLQGQIPRWIGNMPSLEFLDLSRNNFSGHLPPRFGTSSKLRHVSLSRNKLQGPIAMAFYDSCEIFALDLSHNDLTGRIPEWIDRLSNLRFLLLSYNNLEGEIPIQLYRLDRLTLIDLSHNYLSGNIPSLMISAHLFPFQYNSRDSVSSSQHSFEFTTKNVSLSYRGSIVQYFTGIDFSCNNFSGEIPPEIGNLSMIKVLNLSHNSLTGPIPPTFSRLKEIESLDLSYNKLDGEIPPQLTKLFFLEFFNVAHNNLSGKTPARVAQFATFEESCYKDNPFLCGQPLSKVCGAAMSPSPTPTLTTNEDNSGFMDMDVFYVTFGVAYIMVLLVIGAVLYINPYWRRAWFYFIEVCVQTSIGQIKICQDCRGRGYSG